MLERPNTKCSILAVVGSSSPLLLYHRLYIGISEQVWTRAFISSNELQYLHCSLNTWRILPCFMSDVDPPYWKIAIQVVRTDP